MFVSTARRNKHLQKKRDRKQVNNGIWIRKNHKIILINAIRDLIYLSCYSKIIKEYTQALTE